MITASDSNSTKPASATVYGDLCSTTTYTRLHLSHTSADWREYCHSPYEWVITLNGATSYVAFRTEYELRAWAALRGFTPPSLEIGESQFVEVNYKEIHYYEPCNMPHNPSAFPCWEMQNGRYGLALGHVEPDGQAVVTTCQHWREGGISYHWIDYRPTSGGAN